MIMKERFGSEFKKVGFEEITDTDHKHYENLKKSHINNMDPRAPELQMITPDPRPDSDYDPVQLEAGIKVEMEHTNNREVAKSIAKTHIDENRSYYKILDKVGL